MKAAFANRLICIYVIQDDGSLLRASTYDIIYIIKYINNFKLSKKSFLIFFKSRKQPLSSSSYIDSN